MLPALEPYTLVLLVRGERADEPLGEDELDQLQEEHIAYIQDLVVRQKIVVCGPIVQPPDLRLRSLVVYRVPLEEAEALARLDPAVLAGRVGVQAMTWWVQRGRLDELASSFVDCAGPVLAANRPHQP